MKQYLKNFSSETTMKTGNHFKNEVNLQNLSSRKNIKNSYYAYFT
jgi:hypothetical protein